MSEKKISFTHEGLKKLKGEPGRQLEYYDPTSDVCLGIRIGATKKTFFTVYRAEGKKRRYSLGEFPELSVKDAREKARTVAKGKGRVDPAAVRAREKKLKNFSGLCDEFLAVHCAHLREKTREDYERHVKIFKSQWGHLRIPDVSRHVVKGFLQEKAVEHPHAANRLFGTLQSIFSWANKNELTDHNPVAKMERPGFGGKKEPVRRRVLRDGELRAIWRAVGVEQPVLIAYVRILMLTGLRKHEALSAKWDDVDLESRWWRIPQQATKGGDRHDVPITDDMLELFRSLKSFTGDTDYVFASHHTGEAKPFAGVSKAKQRIAKRSGVKDWRLHDLRRSVATRLSEIGIKDEVKRSVLGHKLEGVLGVYDQHPYALEKREAMERWGRRLKEIVEKQEDAEVAAIG